MRDASEFTPVEGQPLMWTDEAGAFYVLAEGMTIDEFVADLNNPTPPIVPAAVFLAQNVVQAWMDSTAQGYGYDNIATAVTYADEPSVPRFQDEGRSFRAWRSQVWAECHLLLAQVEGGEITAPTDAELIAMLPPFKAPTREPLKP